MHHAFTVRYSTKIRTLRTKVGVCLPGMSDDVVGASVIVKEYIALWDTGATGSCISKQIINDLNLKPINIVKTHHAGGTSFVNLYLVNILLPNGVMIGNVKVTEAQLVESDAGNDPERMHILIGMDVIGNGDLAVTNLENTTMSFRIPSVETIDFVPQAKEHNVMEGGNREQRRLLKKGKK